MRTSNGMIYDLVHLQHLYQSGQGILLRYALANVNKRLMNAILTKFWSLKSDGCVIIHELIGLQVRHNINKKTNED